MSDSLLYLDSSGIAKLVLVELESAALIQFLTAWPLRASSALASALSLGGNLGGFVAYDNRLAQAAAAQGMRVFAPGSIA